MRALGGFVRSCLLSVPMYRPGEGKNWNLKFEILDLRQKKNLKSQISNLKSACLASLPLLVASSALAAVDVPIAEQTAAIEIRGKEART